jgi:hypothetical protein
MYKIVAFFVAVVAFVPVPSRADDMPLFPPGAEQREGNLLASIGPQTRMWITQEARREVSSGQASEYTARVALGTLPDIATEDIDQLVFLVMMEMARDADADLQAQMDEMNKINARKQAQRDHGQKMRQTANTSQMQEPAIASAAPTVATRAEAVQPGVRIYTRQATSDRAPADTANNTTDTLDSMNEVSEMNSLRLQMMMDRQAKFISALSNIMERISETQDTLVGNMK